MIKAIHTHKEEDEIVYYCPMCDYSNTFEMVYGHVEEEHTPNDIVSELIHQTKLARAMMAVSKARTKA
jgi:DNA-directed RNA polymerase subunit M/transcription elongation factor TFIIS